MLLIVLVRVDSFPVGLLGVGVSCGLWITCFVWCLVSGLLCLVLVAVCVCFGCFAVLIRG